MGRDLRSNTRSTMGDDGDEEAQVKPIAPDGGYGWVIMFASFIINVLVDGVCFTFGIFYLEFLDYYKESRSYTSWVGSVLNGMYLSMGPIVSALANRFGCRNVTIAGSILACASYILSTYSPNVTVLIITYGALGGAGFGLMYLPAIVMVGYYFQKRRAFATGVAVCGSGIGAFVFAPLCELLLRNYNWQGSVWIISGLVLNGAVMGALFRPLERLISEPVCESGKPDDECGGSNNQSIQDVVSNGKNGVDDPDSMARRLSSLHNIHNNEKSTQLSPFRSLMDITSRERKVSTSSTSGPRANRPLYRKDIFYSGSLYSIPDMIVGGDTAGERRRRKTLDDQDIADLRAEEIVLEDAEDSGCRGRCVAFTSTFSKMMDFSLLGNPVFSIYGASCFLCMAGFYVPFIYLPAHAVAIGLSRDQAAFLLSIIGIANTVARVLCGWVSDQKWADCLIINNTALVIGGLATILSPYCLSYATLVIYSVVFGTAIAVFVSLRSILMVELIGLEKLTNAFGLVTMCQGLSAFIGAPIAGALYDLTGNYNLSFYVAGATLMLAGIICYPLRYVARWQKRKETKRHLVEEDEKQKLNALMRRQNSS